MEKIKLQIVSHTFGMTYPTVRELASEQCQSNTIKRALSGEKGLSTWHFHGRFVTEDSCPCRANNYQKKIGTLRFL